jgi:thioredoxin-related protein/YHS domain-containing protein
MNHPQNRPGRAGLVASLAIGLVGSLTFVAASIAEEPKKINWREDLGQAQAEAKSRDLLLWIQFTGPWCINCRRMDRSTFVHPGVVNYSADSFIPLKLRSDEHEALALSLGLSSLPSTVIVRPDGEVVAKYEGYVEAETFEVTLADVLRREGRSPEQVAKARKRKDEALALAGFCPVTLLNENKLIPGKPDLTAEHEGRLFRFASESNLREFRRKPDAFAPANGGHCPVSQVDRGDLHRGDPHWGVVYGGHLFLFKDGTERDRFVKDPDRYARVDRTDRFNCAHCWSRSSLTQRPASRFTPSYQVEGLLTPTPARLEALLAPTSTIRR